MKKIFYLWIILSVLVLSNSAYTYAQGEGEGIHTPGTGIVSPEIKQQGTGQGLVATPSPIENNDAVRQNDQDRERLQLFITDQKRQLDQEQTRLQEQDRLIYQNQDRTLLGAAILEQVQKTGNNINPVLSQIASQLKTSTQATIRLEQQLQLRNSLMLFLFGSDKNSVNQMEQEVNKNMQLLKNAQQISNDCSSCDAQTRATLQEQIRIMTQEQNRLLNLASQEKNKNGILGWLFK